MDAIVGSFSFYNLLLGNIILKILTLDVKLMASKTIHMTRFVC